jgi:hypothetical protein
MGQRGDGARFDELETLSRPGQVEEYLHHPGSVDELQRPAESICAIRSAE